MNVTLKYFGRLEELTGTAEESIDLNAKTVGELREAITAKYTDLASASFTIAVEQQIAADQQTIEPGAEIALLPPFSGG